MVFVVVNYLSIIELLFHHGRFSLSDVRATGQALLAYSLSMLAYGWIKVLTPFYYSIDRTNFAMRVSLFGILINLAGNAIFAKAFGHVGLALTSSLTLMLNSLILLWGAGQQGVQWQKKRLQQGAILLILASLSGCLLQYGNLQFSVWQKLTMHLGVRWSLLIQLSIQGLIVCLTFGVIAKRFWSVELKAWRLRRSPNLL